MDEEELKKRVAADKKKKYLLYKKAEAANLLAQAELDKCKTDPAAHDYFSCMQKVNSNE